MYGAPSGQACVHDGTSSDAVRPPSAAAGSVAPPIAGAVPGAAGSRQMPDAAGTAVAGVELGLEVMRAVLARLNGPTGPASEAHVCETIARVLVELGGYDCVVVWRVDGFAL